MADMKKVLVACGTGIATSVAVSKKIEGIFKERGFGGKITFSTCSVAELESKAPYYDLIITTARISKQLPIKVILGVAFLTGVGMEPVIKDIISSLELS